MRFYPVTSGPASAREADRLRVGHSLPWRLRRDKVSHLRSAGLIARCRQYLGLRIHLNRCYFGVAFFLLDLKVFSVACAISWQRSDFKPEDQP